MPTQLCQGSQSDSPKITHSGNVGPFARKFTLLLLLIKAIFILLISRKSIIFYLKIIQKT